MGASEGGLDPHRAICQLTKMKISNQAFHAARTAAFCLNSLL